MEEETIIEDEEKDSYSFICTDSIVSAKQGFHYYAIINSDTITKLNIKINSYYPLSVRFTTVNSLLNGDELLNINKDLNVNVTAPTINYRNVVTNDDGITLFSSIIKNDYLFNDSIILEPNNKYLLVISTINDSNHFSINIETEDANL